MAPSDVQDVIAKTVSMQKNRARISALEKEKCKSDDVAKSINDLQDEAKRNNAIENNEAGGAHNHLLTLPMNLIPILLNHLLILPMKLLPTLHRRVGI